MTKSTKKKQELGDEYDKTKTKTQKHYYMKYNTINRSKKYSYKKLNEGNKNMSKITDQKSLITT